ncbi:MAG TPA: DNA polymerase III subunit alpha [Candidatus Paceibacterota bacterium]
MSKFVHLHVHSHYSLLQALPKIPDLIVTAKKNEMPALALTDNGNLYGAIEFYKTCKKENIKPIIGLDAYVAIRTRLDKQAGVDNRRARLVLLAKNLTGYKNLIKLVTYSHLEGFYYKPRIDRELLEKYHEGLVALLPSFSSEVSLALKNRDKEKAEMTTAWYKKIFGEDCYLEITHHPEIENHQELMKEIIVLGKKINLPLVAAHDVYYINPEDKKARETLLSIQNGGDGADRQTFGGDGDFSFISEKQMSEYFADRPEAILGTKSIVEKCNLEIPLGQWVFPEFKLPNSETPDETLQKIVAAGFKKRNIAETKELKERVEYELKVIKDKGYAPYFLVVSDLLRFAHENKILTTIRGSVAGSLVTYLAGITNVNPIEYKLPFERFLNPERPSAPDIDMDFADNRRDEMIEYAKQKYGADKVAQIGTFGTMMARGAIRDVARALGFEYAVGDKISKMIPLGSQGFPMTLDRALEMVAELKTLYKNDKDAKEIIDLGKKIEGCARHISVHAAGVVIAPKPLIEYTSLQYDPKGEGLPSGKAGKIITQYDMYAVEEIGLLKFDFLGIKNLSILADAVERIEKLEGKKIDIENIPLNDKKTFEMLAKGETAGLFQLNGDAMTKFLIDLKPTEINDINVMVALFRPGPMKNIPEYIARKHKQKPVIYLHPKMEKYLKESYGILVYQEDIMFTALELAGYTWKTVDKLRKAIGKKIPEEMAEQHEIFVEGCQKHSDINKDKAEKIWGLFEPFQGYGFNKAHAASYGKVAYQTAYLKANFPAIYMSAVLTAESGDVEKIGETIAECKRMNIPVLPPSVNESFSQFTVVKEDDNYKIRFGLVTIKNFGQGVSTAIIEERKRAGRFKSLGDFLMRVQDKNLNKKSLEALIKAGALDEFGERGAMLANTENLLAYNRECSQTPASQDSLFGAFQDSAVPDLRLETSPPIAETEKLAWEKELLGLYISGHPLNKYREKLEKREVNIRRVKEELREGMEAVVAGIMEETRTIITKNNEQMMFAQITDFTGSIEVVIFPRIFNEYKKILATDKLLAIKGRISNRNGTISIIAEKIKELN